MSENTNKKFDLEVTRPHDLDEVESARILFQEGLFEEAKKKLFRILSHKPGYPPAKKLLTQIEDVEMKDLFVEGRPSRSRGKTPKPENPDQVIEALERDLGLGSSSLGQGEEERWSAVSVKKEKFTPQEHLDLGIAFIEMECYADALRELLRAEKQIRIEQTFLGEVGVTVVSLIAQCMIPLGRAFEAKSYLEPVLIEPDLKHEDKLCLYYAMAMVELALDSKESALGWFKQVAHIDPDFRDAQMQIRLLIHKK